MFTKGLMTTAFPIFAPKSLNKKRLKPESGKPERNQTILVQYHIPRTKKLAPGLYQELLKRERSVRDMRSKNSKSLPDRLQAETFGSVSVCFSLRISP